LALNSLYMCLSICYLVTQVHNEVSLVCDHVGKVGVASTEAAAADCKGDSKE